MLRKILISVFVISALISNGFGNTYNVNFMKEAMVETFNELLTSKDPKIKKARLDFYRESLGKEFQDDQLGNIKLIHDEKYDITLHYNNKKTNEDIYLGIEIETDNIKATLNKKYSKSFNHNNFSAEAIAQFIETHTKQSSFINLFINEAHAVIISMPIVIGVTIGMTVASWTVNRDRIEDAEQNLGGDYCCKATAKLKKEITSMVLLKDAKKHFFTPLGKT